MADDLSAIMAILKDLSSTSTAAVALALIQSTPLAILHPTTGVAAADGQTTIPLPASAPANSPWWVRLTVNGVIQRPGVDFTTDGTATAHLNFSLTAGDTWFAEQLQRSLP